MATDGGEDAAREAEQAQVEQWTRVKRHRRGAMLVAIGLVLIVVGWIFGHHSWLGQTAVTGGGSMVCFGLLAMAGVAPGQR